ncbi:hypothetical protein, partial [Enterococcus faecalis]|uniref:hypothetical protein n=1 Tax=Enterococcus faecalis TaxID=1351 RepID=UPI001F053F9B
IGNPSLNHRYRKGFYSLFKTLQQNRRKLLRLNSRQIKRLGNRVKNIQEICQKDEVYLVKNNLIDKLLTHKNS